MAENIFAKESGNDLMLYDKEKESLHILNATARLIYNLYQEGKSLTEIEEAVRNHFQYENNEVLRNDIQKCLDELKHKKLIET